MEGKKTEVAGHYNRGACPDLPASTSRERFLLETPAPNLSDGMRALGGRYAQAFNRRHGSEVGATFGVRQARVSNVLGDVRSGRWKALRPALDELEKGLLAENE